MIKILIRRQIMDQSNFEGSGIRTFLHTEILV